MSHLHKKIAKLTVAAAAAAMLSTVPAQALEGGNGWGNGWYKYHRLGKEARRAAKHTDSYVESTREARRNAVHGVQMSPFGMSIMNELHGHKHSVGKKGYGGCCDDGPGLESFSNTR